MGSPTDADAIRILIADHPDGLSIHDVAVTLGIHRNTASKYLEVLHSQGLLDIRRVGATKLYYSSLRVPVSCVLRLFSEPVFAIDRERMIQSTNEAAQQLVGLTNEECHGRPLAVLESITGPGIYDAVLPVLRGQTITIPGVFHSSRQNEYLIKAFPVRFDTGRSGAALVFLKKEDENGASDEPSSDIGLSILRMMKEPVIVRFKDDGSVLFANEGFVSRFSPSAPHMSGRRMPLLIPDPDLPLFSKAVQDAKLTGQVCSEFRVIHSSGDVRMYRWQILSVCQGSTCDLLAVGFDITDYHSREEQFRIFYESTEELFGERTHDLREINRQLYQEITERKLAEETLRLYEYTIRSVADLVIWFTFDGSVTYLNDAARMALHIPKTGKDLKIRSFFEHPPLGDWQLFFRELMDKRHLFLDASVFRTDGMPLPVEARFTFLKHGDKEFCCCVARDIQERLDTLKVLIASENRFRELAETIPDVVYLFDLKTGEIQYLNRAFERVFGRSCRDIYTVPENWRDWIHPDDRERVISESGIPAGNLKTMEFRIIRPDGGVRWVTAKIHYIRDIDGVPVREVGIATDSTLAKITHSELVKTNERFRLALDIVPVTMFSQNLDLEYTWIVNSSIGLTESDVIGCTDKQIFPPETETELTRIKRQVLEAQKPVKRSIDVVFGGKIFPTQIYLQPDFDPRGQVTGLTGVAINMQDILHVKRSYAMNEEKYRRLFDAMDEGYIVFSPVRSEAGEIVDFQISDLNRFAIRCLKRRKPELVGRMLSDFRPDIDHRWREMLYSVAETGKEVGFEYHSKYFDGSYALSAFPVSEERIGVVMRDITDLYRMQENLKLHRDLARDLSATTDINHALRLILQSATEVPGIDCGGVYLAEQNESGDTTLIMHHHFGLSEEYIKRVREVRVESSLEQFFSSGDPVYYSMNNLRPEWLYELLQREGISSYLVIPLVLEGRLLGSLNLGSHSLAEIPEREKPFLESLSAWLGRSVARLLHDTLSTREQAIGYAVIKPDGAMIEGTLWTVSGIVPDDVIDCIRKNREELMTMQDIHYTRTSGGRKEEYDIRFCPWGSEIAYFIRSRGKP